VLLKLVAVAPQGAVKLKSGSCKILKYIKKYICIYIFFFYIIDPLKNLNKLATESKPVVWVNQY
jgi:hypothetical protein